MGRLRPALALVLGWTCACSFDPSGAPGRGPSGAPDGGSGADAEPLADPADAASVPAAGQVMSVRTQTAPALDGELEDAWLAAEPTSFPLSDAMQFFNMNPAYAWDASLTFSSLYDDDRFYFLFEVSDTNVVDDSVSAYDDDAVEIYLDASGDAAGPYGDDDHWIVVQSSGVYKSYGAAEIDITGSVVETDGGYRIEIAIARDELGAEVSSGLGFNVGLVDDDELGGDDEADAYGLWYVPEGPRCDDCCEGEDGARAWCDTSMFGRLLLL